MSEIIEGGPTGKSYDLKKYELAERIAMFKKWAHWICIIVICAMVICTKIFDWNWLWIVLTLIVWGGIIDVGSKSFEISNQINYDHLVKLAKGLQKKLLEQEIDRLGLYSRRLKFKKKGLELGANKQEIRLMEEIEDTTGKYTILLSEIEKLLVEEVGSLD